MSEEQISWLRDKEWKYSRALIRLKAGGEGDDRGWDGWMASPTQGRWVWVNSGSWWWTGRPDVLWFMGSQRVRHDWATELTDRERERDRGKIRGREGGKGGGKAEKVFSIKYYSQALEPDMVTCFCSHSWALSYKLVANLNLVIFSYYLHLLII